MNQLARCANCSRPFIKSRRSKLYCKAQCADAAAHRAHRARGKLIAEQQYADEQRIIAARAEQALQEVTAAATAAEAETVTARDKLRSDSASALADTLRIMEQAANKDK